RAGLVVGVFYLQPPFDHGARRRRRFERLHVPLVIAAETLGFARKIQLNLAFFLMRFSPCLARGEQNAAWNNRLAERIVSPAKMQKGVAAGLSILDLDRVRLLRFEPDRL